MLSRKVIEGQEDVTVFGQFPHRLVVFHAVRCHEEVKCGLRIHARFTLPNVVKMAFGFGLNRLVLPRFSSGLFRAMFAMKEIENGTEIHR